MPCVSLTASLQAVIVTIVNGKIMPAAPPCSLSHAGNCMCGRVFAVKSQRNTQTHTHTHRGKTPENHLRYNRLPLSRGEQQAGAEQQNCSYCPGKDVEAATAECLHLMTSHGLVHNAKSLRDETVQVTEQDIFTGIFIFSLTPWRSELYDNMRIKCLLYTSGGFFLSIKAFTHWWRD